jgi:predicted extracellular nuclease
MDFSLPIVDQPVTVEDIVTANNLTGTSGVIGYFLQDAAGGAWSGVFVYDNKQAPEIGDIVILSATVSEYFDTTEMDRIQPLTAFPNPTAGNLRVDFPTAGQLVIIGLDGKIAQSQMVTAGAGRLSLDALATGLYLVELRTEGQVYRTRVSKH